MRPHSENLITHFIFPQLCFAESDEALWVDDPVEYVHSKIDPLEDFTSPSSAAARFMTVMARYRKNAFMQILTLANNVLQKYSETPAEARNPREKDGALVVIGNLATLIVRNVSRDVKFYLLVFVVICKIIILTETNDFLEKPGQHDGASIHQPCLPRV